MPRATSVPAIEVYYVASDRGGWKTPKLVKQGTTVEEFLEKELGKGYSPEDYQIRVNRESVDADHELEAGDTVSVSPAKIEGAVHAI